MSVNDVLYLTDEQRSMIASAFIAGRVATEHSLCCATDGLAMCEVIVGRVFAQTLRNWFYDELGCTQFEDRNSDLDYEQRNLDKISDMDVLGA